MSLKIQHIMLLVLFPVLTLNQGCVGLLAGAGAGAGGVAYIRGDLETTERTSIHRVWDATQQAVKELEFAVQETDKDATAAVLKAETADGKRIRIDLTAVEENKTRLYIRVGVFGNQKRSRLILQTIEKYL